MTGQNDTATRAANNGHGRVPPHNLEAQAALLGAMTLTKNACAAGFAACSPDDFYGPDRLIAQAAHDIYGAGDLPDPVALAGLLDERHQLKKIGGPVTLVNYQAGTPSTGNAARYAGLIKDHADRRRAIAAAHKIIEAAHEQAISAPELATEMMTAAVALVDATNNRLNIYTMEQLAHEHLDAMEERGQPGAAPGLMTGLRALDEHTGGLRDGELVTVIAEPGVGKSALVGNIARLISATSTPVLGVSVEMARLEMMDRIVAAEARIPLSVLRSGKLATSHEDPHAGAITRLLADNGLFLVDDPDVTLDQIDAAIRRTRAKLFIVDYAQILKAPEGSGTREREVAAISSGLKRMARRHHIPGIVLSAINRNVASRADQRPVRSDIRESGQLEYDSNEIWGLYRDELSNPETPEPGIMEVIVLKSRNSKAGTVKLRYDPDTQLISDLPSPGATR